MNRARLAQDEKFFEELLKLKSLQGFYEKTKSTLETFVFVGRPVPRIVVESLCELYHASSLTTSPMTTLPSTTTNSAAEAEPPGPEHRSPTTPSDKNCFKSCQNCSILCGIRTLTCHGCDQRPFLECEVEGCEKNANPNATIGSSRCKKCFNDL